MALTQISTAGVKDDAVTSGKIPANAVGSSELADNAVDTAAIADDAVTDAKLANSINSAIAANTAKVQTTINNNADNRVITGSGTANTLEGESDLTFSSNTLDVNNAVKLPDAGTVHFGVSDTAYVRGKDSTDGYIKLGTAGVDRLQINPSGHVSVPSGYIGSSLTDTFTLNGKTQPHYGLSLAATSSAPIGLSGYYGIAFATQGTERVRILNTGGVTFNGDTAAANALDDYEEGTWTPSISYQNSGDQGDASNLAMYGWYTKVGNLVTAGFFLRWTLTGSAANDNISVTGLPFGVSAITSTYGNAGAVGSMIVSGTSLNAQEPHWLHANSDNSTVLLFTNFLYAGNAGNEFGANTGMRMWGSIAYRTT